MGEEQQQDRGYFATDDMLCPECGTAVREGQANCPGCGTAIEWETGLECPQCLADVPDGARACPGCGLAFEIDGEVPPPEEGAVAPTDEEEDLVPVEVEPEAALDDVITTVETGIGGEGFIDGNGVVESGGVYDAHGMLNGKGLTEGRGLTNGVGLTNGTGLTNGQGLTNGTGLTVVDISELRGLTNGTGMTNGRGLTNGLGLTNGTGLTNGSGLTNGVGMTNGRGLTNGTGMTNGRGVSEPKGLTNGAGRTNGLEAGPGRTPRLPRRRTRRTGVMVAAMFTVLLVSVAFVWMSIPLRQDEIKVDGSFSDWNDVSAFTDARDPAQVANVDVDIKDWALTIQESELGVRVRVAGAMLSAKAGDDAVDTVRVFIDNDSRAASGYRVRGIGAEWMVEVSGWGGDVHTASASMWAAGSDVLDLTGFVATGSVRASASGDQLELEVERGDRDWESLARIAVYITDNGASEDWSDVVINDRGAALDVRQAQVGDDLNLTLLASGGDVEVRSIIVDYGGGTARGTAKVVYLDRTYSGSYGDSSRIEFETPVTVAANGRVELLVTNELAGPGVARPLVLTSDDVELAGDAVATVLPPASWAWRQTAGLPVGDITIDGNFDDWRSLWTAEGGRVDDPAGDVVRASDPGDVSHIDIVEHSALLTPVVSRGDLSLYVKTSGPILNGRLVPRQLRPGEPGPAGEPSPRLPMFLEDRTTFYIDVNDDGKDEFMVVVRGKSGQVLDGGGVLSRYIVTAGTWQETRRSIAVGLDSSSLETKVALSELGLGRGTNVSVYIVTTDWSGARDDAEASARSGPVGVLYADEQGVAPFSVRQGETGVAVLRIDLENRGDIPAEVDAVSATRLGTLDSVGLAAVEVWSDARDAVAFDAGLARSLSRQAVWTGDVAAMNLAPPFAVGPRTAVTLWVTVDIAKDATTVDWFDLWVLNSGGLRTRAHVVLGDVHDSYKLIRVWNETGGSRWANITQISINEFYPNPGTSENEWVELINPTASEIDISGWKVLYFKSGDYRLVKTFSSGEKIAGSNYIKAWDVGSSDAIPSDGMLMLRDASNGSMDFISYSSSTSQKSVARFHNATGYPTDVIQNPADITKGTANALIPEYDTLVAPALATLVAFAVIRRRGSAEARTSRR